MLPQSTAAARHPARQKRWDWFPISLALAVVCAGLFPELGAKGGPLKLDLLSKVGVAFIFTTQGLLLSFGALRAGARAWRVHLIAQGTTYIFFPALGLLVARWGADFLPVELRYGVFFLCSLPSTLSSSVALTATAGGNTAVAALSATLSNVAGIVVTPLWLSTVFTNDLHSQSGSDQALNLMLWLGLPFAVGQLLRPRAGRWAEQNKRLVINVDQGIVVLLVFGAFCDSVQARLWSTMGTPLLLMAAGFAVAFQVASLGFAYVLSNWFRLAPADRVAAVYCGSHKTLATGVPMAALLFGSHPSLGAILLPLMIYHPLQLFLGAWFARGWLRVAEPHG